MAIRLVGLDEWNKLLKENVTVDDVKKVVQYNGNRLVTTMKGMTSSVYVKGYSTGDTGGSISAVPLRGGMAVAVGASMPYDPYVEHGTRFMEAEPILQPSLDVVGPKFQSDIKKLLK